MSIWRIDLLSQRHLRGDFDCGEESLNEFLRSYAGQHARKDISRTYVAAPEGEEAVVGYHALSAGSVTYAHLPPELARHLPRHPVPTAHLGRLAVDRRFQNQGLGTFLLLDALKRVKDLADKIGICAVTVWALSDRARAFYLARGFEPLLNHPSNLFLPMVRIRKLWR